MELLMNIIDWKRLLWWTSYMILVVFYLWNLIAMYHGGCWWKSMNIIYKGWFSIATFDCWRAFCYYAVSSVNLTIQSYIPTYGPDYHDITLTGDVFTILSLKIIYINSIPFFLTSEFSDHHPVVFFPHGVCVISASFPIICPRPIVKSLWVWQIPGEALAVQLNPRSCGIYPWQHRI